MKLKINKNTAKNYNKFYSTGGSHLLFYFCFIPMR